MEPIQSFLTFFYILDSYYGLCKEDDLGAFLGMISPEIWTHGLPSDIAIYDDWKELIVKDACVTKENILVFGKKFLEMYAGYLEFNFEQTLNLLKNQIDPLILEQAIKKANKLCEKHQYTI